eukprot:TRINITY_DN1346_c1_g2_i1.p1 TRINITY_DN1346_c1_g2~~TRINITY_DN1346_c1_g2_i1.p1  ORF type:complete len:372 (+),score=145.68 TRINITY_DN1346_c1_g2_i1:87-1118(+)
MPPYGSSTIGLSARGSQSRSPIKTSQPSSLSRQYDRTYADCPVKGVRDTYERARQAVEEARRELEERKRALSAGKQTTAASPTPYAFLTQAPRSQQTSGGRTPRWSQPEGELTPRGGYGVSQKTDIWSPPATHKSSSGVEYDYATEEPILAQSPRTAISTADVHAQPAGRRKTLVIDLDETLVHSCFEPCSHDMRINMTMDGVTYTAYVKKRPGANEFLRKATQMFDVMIWTASLDCYASPVIDELERRSGCGRLRRMYRESCSRTASGYVKDLRSLHRPLSEVCILDNTPGVASLQPRNLIDISSWYDDRSDRELYKLLPFLDRLASADSVHDAIRRRHAGH